MKSPDYYFNSIDNDLIAERLNKLIITKKEYPENVLCYTENQWRDILGISSDENIGTAALFCWGFTKGIYDFDRQLISELCVTGTEELDKFPEILDYLPQQCVYLKLTEVGGGPMEFWALRLSNKLLLVQNHSDGTDPSVHQLNLSGTTSFTQAIEEYRCSIAAQWLTPQKLECKASTCHIGSY